MRNNKILISSIVGAFAFAMAGPAWATPKTFEQTLTLPVHLSVFVEALDCSNHQGPFVTIGGSWSTDPIDATVSLRSPSGKLGPSGSGSVTATFTAVAENGGKFNKQPAFSGVGGNPYVWVQLPGYNGGNPYFAGRCVQGFSWKNTGGSDPLVNVKVGMLNTASECSPKGSTVDLSQAQSSHDPIQMNVILDSQWTGTKRPSNKAVSVTVGLTGSGGVGYGTQIRGIGGNPEVWMNFDDLGAGLVGRCKDLMP